MAKERGDGSCAPKGSFDSGGKAACAQDDMVGIYRGVMNIADMGD